MTDGENLAWGQRVGELIVGLQIACPLHPARRRSTGEDDASDWKKGRGEPGELTDEHAGVGSQWDPDRSGTELYGPVLGHARVVIRYGPGFLTCGLQATLER